MIKARITAVMLSCMLLAVFILFRAAYIQILPNPKLEAMARHQYVSRSLIRPIRGTISDRNGEPLAVNIGAQSLAANPNLITNPRSMARLISRSTDIPFAKVLHRLNEDKDFVWIKRHLNDSELRRLKKQHLMDSDGQLIDGLWLVKEIDRVYPHGQLASHVLGDVNVDLEGVEGVELWMNEKLRGKVVSVSAIKDALGRPTFIDAVAAKNVQDGESLTLTLDASLQFEVEQELRNAVQKAGAQAGTVIVMNADTGEVLAMANEPSFNSSNKATPQEKRRNRAVTDGFEPGSIMKAILATSALTHGWKLSDEVWGERGSFILQKHKISEAEAKEKFEWVSLKKMIQVSSNVAAAKVALKLGVERYLRTVKLFGLGNKTGLGFPGEISGLIPKKKDWQPLTLANIGFGQGILVTPLQMIRAYGAILNGGLLVQPTLFKSTSPGYTTEEPIRIFSQRVSKELIEALASVTEPPGTGVKAALPGFRVAGKTGTAQMVEPGTGKYSREKYIASFVGFPVDVEPKIVIFTSIVEPRGVYYASETAAPLFREVLSSVANRCSLPVQVAAAQAAAKTAATAAAVAAAKTGSKEDAIHLAQAAPQVVEEVPKTEGVAPPLQGLTLREIFRALGNHHYQWEVMGSGVVKTQIPEPGKPLLEGATVRLILSEP